ncbi:MAG: 30S ribosomal protein S27e [Candidatus Ranarchaeia archaeon]
MEHNQDTPQISRPSSRFLVIRCPECNNEQTIFSHATHQVKCEVCGKVLSKPTGGKAILYGELVQVLD